MVPSVKEQQGGFLGAKHSDRAGRGRDLARRGPILTAPDRGEQSRTAEGNHALPRVQIAREVCGDGVDPNSSQEFRCGSGSRSGSMRCVAAAVLQHSSGRPSMRSSV